MRINNGSICSKCIYFDHECDIPYGDDYYCKEYCESPKTEIQDKFYSFAGVIKECETFKE